MSNSDSMSMGGVSSAIGPLLMRKMAPLSVQMQDISVPELDVFKDNIFSSVSGRLWNVSFRTDVSARSPEFNARVHTIANQLDQVVAHSRLRK